MKRPLVAAAVVSAAVVLGATTAAAVTLGARDEGLRRDRLVPRAPTDVDDQPMMRDPVRAVRGPAGQGVPAGRHRLTDWSRPAGAVGVPR